MYNVCILVSELHQCIHCKHCTLLNTLPILSNEYIIYVSHGWPDVTALGRVGGTAYYCLHL